ncbi:glycerol-3-phosphate dehydrogenase subunit GlpB [Natrialbaceae archaeon GCM10025810]|uniref:glycerol-3-phosphate dehydrogenase subunit GlpB n=1 Tax=Halovalidus salilacus TaxID=3075124 RepID=UPI003608AF64
MPIEDDVLVIGGGIAGSMAALAAARREPNARVRLLSYKQSTLRHASGLIDVLGYPPDAGAANGSRTRPGGSGGTGPLADPFDALPDLPDGHPYERVGVDAVREGLALFDEVVGDAYAGDHTDANALVPTHGGTVKPTARYPTSSAAGLASDPRNTLLVGFETITDFDAPLAAAHLRAAGVPFDVEGVTLRFPGIKRDDAKVTRYARLLDRDESAEMDSGWGTETDAAGAGETTVREALADAVAPHLEDAGADRVGFPAILGADRPDEVRRDLEARLGVDVFEVPMGPPSLPGIRLEDLLYGTLKAEGVRLTTGVPVVDYEANADGSGAGDGTRIDRVIVDRKGREVPYRASQYVLATGGLVGKGVRSDRPQAVEGAEDDGASNGQTGVVFEPIFDCHVAHSGDRYDWFDGDAFGDHPFARFGLAVDHDLRPLDDGGRLEFSNLRAAGAVLGGYDFAAEKSGAGVSIATGYVAGDRAGEEASG